MEYILVSFGLHNVPAYSGLSGDKYSNKSHTRGSETYCMKLNSTCYTLPDVINVRKCNFERRYNNYESFVNMLTHSPPVDTWVNFAKEVGAKGIIITARNIDVFVCGILKLRSLNYSPIV